MQFVILGLIHLLLRHNGNGPYFNLFNALEAVGVAIVFSAGNAGSGDSTITPPKNINIDLVNVFCVGALNGNSMSLPIASFSSRGPSICGDTGSLAIKPEVSAPGVGVRSCVPGNGYSNLSGTSMAAPHATGAVLLLKEAFPYLTGTQLKLALYFSATDLGDPGEDNIFGMGIINVHAAYQYLINQGHIPVAPLVNNDLAVKSLEGIEEVICDQSLQIAPTFKLLNAGLQNVTTANIKFSLSNGMVINMPFTGNVAPNDSIVVQMPVTTLPVGYYELVAEVDSVNGMLDERFFNNKITHRFLLTDLLPVATSNATTCYNSAAIISATHLDTTGVIRWYDSEFGLNSIGTGQNYVTPPLMDDATYYADLISHDSLGIFDNSTGVGGYSNDLDVYLKFDAHTAFTLKTVTVYVNSAGGRRIELVDRFGHTIGQHLFIPTGAGEYTITLNFNVPKGQGYRLRPTTGADYYYNSGGAFPYEILGVASITGSNNNDYHYFYNWQIEYGTPCGRQPVTVMVTSDTTHTTTFTQSTDTIDYAVTTTPIQFTNTTTGGTDILWDFGDGDTSTDPNPTHSYTQNGMFMVSLSTTNANGCSHVKQDTVWVFNYFPVNTIPIPNLFEKVSVFPNPSNGQFNVQFNLDQPTLIKIQVFDLLGREVLSKGKQYFSRETMQLDLNAYRTGIYLLRLEANGQQFVYKLVKL